MTNHIPQPRIVVLPTDLISAMEMVADESNKLINWLGELLPELERAQIGYLAATLLSLYINHLQSDLDAIDSIKTTAENIKNIPHKKNAD